MCIQYFRKIEGNNENRLDIFGISFLNKKGGYYD